MRRRHKMLLGLTALAALLGIGGAAYLQHPKFGAAPASERLERIRRSPNYADGAFHNLVPTQVLIEGASSLSIIASDAVKRPQHLRPAHAIPALKANLKALDLGRDAIVWLGHSSYFLVFGGHRILIDPVFSVAAAPLPFANRAFDGTNLYSVDDLPPIELLLISHDHWDHLDYQTVSALHSKVRRAFVPLGIGADLEHWGYRADQIVEADWFDALEVGGGLAVHLIPARHYSGRLLTPNKTLWGGFALVTPKRRLLFGGDTGYGPHFAEIARRFGRFDLAALDMGQYDPRWPDIHMTPEQAAQAAEDLHAAVLLPAHVGRFSIARHAWTEPFERIVAASRAKPSSHLATPAIGEALDLDAGETPSDAWWRAVDGDAAALSP